MIKIRRFFMHIISYNIRYDFPDDGLDNWHHRKETLKAQIKKANPDIFCLQEVLYEPYIDIKKYFPEYNSFGVGRDDGHNKGEFNPIFYHKKYFTQKDQGTFWLSKTPTIPSSNWKSGCNRMMTYLLLEENKTETLYLIVNTHLDNASEKARTNQALVLINEIENIPRPEQTPVILCGDMNAQPQDDAIQILRKKFTQAEDIASKIEGPSVTFNGFKRHASFHEMIKIDYFFFNNIAKITQFKTHVLKKDGRYVSDHFMIDIYI